MRRKNGVGDSNIIRGIVLHSHLTCPCCCCPPKGGVGQIYLSPHFCQQHYSSQIMQLQVVVAVGGKGWNRAALAASVKVGGEEFRCTNRLTAMEAATTTVATHKILMTEYLEASTHMVMLLGRRRSMICGGGDNKYQGGGIFSLICFWPSSVSP